MRRAATVCATLALLAVTGAPAVAAPLEQLPGRHGCLTPPGTEQRCTPATGLFGPDSVVVSPDARHVYVAARDRDFLLSVGSSAIATFARDRRTGRLRQRGCISDDGGDGRPGTDGACRDGDALRSANALAVSPDGRHVYATSDEGGIAVLARDPRSGLLAPASCVKDHAPDSHCVDAYAMPRPVSIAVSGDGLHVYATSRGSHAVLAFARDPSTGGLRQLGCLSDDGAGGLCAEGLALKTPTSVALSPDGRNAYVTGGGDQSSLVVLDRDALTGTVTHRECFVYAAPPGDVCRAGRGLVDASGVAVSVDGRSVYTSAIESAAVATWTRDPATGGLRQVDCIAAGGGYTEDAETLDESCRRGPPLAFAAAVAVDPSGRRVYALAAGASAVHAFRRDPATGRLRFDRCLQQGGDGRPCRRGRGLFGAKGLAVAPRGGSVYVAADTGNAVSVFRTR